MYRYRAIIHFCVFIIVVALAFNNSYNPFILNDAETFSYTVSKSEESLLQKIRTKSTKYRKPPENAIIDKVWKKTPGLNGIRVDVNKSYEQMKKGGVFDETLLVYEQIPPNITYKELPAAPTYRGHPEKDMVSFLINVSWGDEYIPSILNVLKKHNVKATFFIEGKWAQENADFVKMIDEQGHVIGNHAYNHPDMSRLSKKQITEQINRTNEILKAITDNKPKWLAPPSGSYNDQVVKIAHEMNMETILWSVDTIDWKNPSVSVMMNRVNNNIHPGATVLMHPTSSTAQGLDSLIVNIKEKGYKIGTITSLMNEER
ncbi:polysaccharide deacetylase family sporulation protein PdaB [Virgibacillus subterraneus]|uniref:Polysaccharide deacetylase family sporulation protein PdaB n=1 Tax=Virgibacillus subterraneus TaxID=621109 RepID=A0A1H9H373_9BACI|nr:polysaccharide deacetylase family protein [Virgibacillus subterraneus]SEQ56795.1 polysaccharide deacetylase family sporulation protein PdaB [Virgibacillus subterraneus]